MNRQRPLVCVRGIRSTNPMWHCIFLLALIFCYTGSLARPVDAANIGKSRTVRPLPTRNDSQSSHTVVPRRLPFLPSRNPRRAAKEAYLLHLRNELESAQRELYVSQNTCTTLRKRWEDQRRETLELMASLSRNADNGEKERQKISDQEKEIARLHEQLQTESGQHEEHIERINLMSSELKELLSWKETEKQTYEEKLSEYKQKLQDSHRKQSGFAEQVQLLALKLEAAEFVARQRLLGEEEVGESKSNEQRAQVLRSQLESVRSEYLKVLINSVQDSAKMSKEQQMQIEEEMDSALQVAFESALDTIDNEWSGRYETLENQLRNITDYAANLVKERDSAIHGEQASVTEKFCQNLGSPGLSKSQKQQLREELTAELTNSLTNELTEKLTKQLTMTSVEKIERKYEKKINRLHKELKLQQTKASELERSQEEMTREQKQTIEAEIEKVKDQYKQEYETKLHQLQTENEAQVEVQKERMRKLVRALLDREAKQKGEKAEVNTAPVAEKINSPSRKKKRRGDSTCGGGAKDAGGNSDEIVPASLSGSRRRSTPGVVSVRGNHSS